MSYIQFQDVVKTYGEGHSQVVANDHITFEMEKGEFVVILGPSGAGKSTVLNILGGMDNATSGSIWVDGQDIGGFNDLQLTQFRRSNVGFVFQFYNLIPNLTAKENVDLAEQIADQPMDTQYAIEAVGLSNRQNNFPAELSGGEQQRVSIARALAKNPKLLLCDEPTGALDYETGKQVLKLLQDQCFERGTTVVVITHNQAIAPMADRIIEINNAKVKAVHINQTPTPVAEIEW